MAVRVRVRVWPYVCLFILHYPVNSAARRSNSPQFSRLLNFQTFNHGLNYSKIHTARQFCECLLFVFSAIDCG